MHSRISAPLARKKGLVVEELGDELLVYDLDDKHAHCLTPVAARVWAECDGKSRPEAIASRLGIDETEVTYAIGELERCELLQTMKPKKNGLSRRDFGLKVTKVAAASATLPLILSIAAPAVAAGESQEIFCIALTPADNHPGFWGTNNCNVCNQQTGANTLCCCCHDPTQAAGGKNIYPGLKACAADAKQCCCTPAQGESNGWGGSHCTEPNGVSQTCSTLIAAGGCSAP